MLPLLRIIPVGGVFLAIMIVILAVNPPGGTQPPMPQSAAPARGVLVNASEHPEWLQFLIHAAVRRADELERLRELPDTPVRIPDVQVEVPPAAAAEEPPKVAALPTDRIDTGPEDETGSVSEVPSATIPIEIGETSSTELPVTPPPAAPPAIKTPERSKSLNESRSKPVQRVRRAKAPAKQVPPATPTFFETLFGTAQGQPQTAATAQAARPATARNANPPAPARPAKVSADQR